MAGRNVDYDGLNREDIRQLREATTPADIPFALRKISHVVLKVQDLEKSAEFYTKVLGMRVSDAYPQSMMPGRMLFLRYNSDHHGIALIGGAEKNADASQMHHFALEVDTLDELFSAREHLLSHGVNIHFQGRRRAGQQIAIEFADPDNHQLEICWHMDQIAPGESPRPADQWRTASTLEEAVANPPLPHNEK